MDIDAVVDFVMEIEKFKACERDCRTSCGLRPESDAEHSWHLAVFLMVLENQLSGVDFPKLIKMALIHDLPELYAGDTNPYRGDTAGKEEREKEAAAKLFAKLPDSVSESFHALFEEYINQTSPEARFVKAADKLMPLVQNLCTNPQHSAYRKRKVTYEEVVRYMGPFFASGTVLDRFYSKLLARADAGGVFHKQQEGLRAWENRPGAVGEKGC